MRPESGVSWPLSWAISVVLPAPFGPITACSSPSGILRMRSSVATMPPKRLARFSMRNKSVIVASVMAHLAEQTVDAAARKQNDQQQQRPEDDLPIFSDAGQHFFQDQQGHRAEQRAKCRAHAAEDDHDDEITRTRPIHHRRADEIGMIGKQRPRKPAHCPGNDETDELVTISRKA